eukprot:9755-Hanusia_phi.AAC.1
MPNPHYPQTPVLGSLGPPTEYPYPLLAVPNYQYEFPGPPLPLSVKNRRDAFYLHHPQIALDLPPPPLVVAAGTVRQVTHGHKPRRLFQSVPAADPMIMGRRPVLPGPGTGDTGLQPLLRRFQAISYSNAFDHVILVRSPQGFIYLLCHH